MYRVYKSLYILKTDYSIKLGSGNYFGTKLPYSYAEKIIDYFHRDIMSTGYSNSIPPILRYLTDIKNKLQYCKSVSTDPTILIDDPETKIQKEILKDLGMIS